MGLFSKRKAGISSYQYNKRYGGFKSKAQHVFNTHNSRSVASLKEKQFSGGMNALTADGRASPKELDTYIASLENTNIINKHEASDLRKVFAKELAKKDTSSASWSLFGRPEGISKARLEKDTLGSRSIDHQLYSGLSGHDRITKNKLAGAVHSILAAATEGGHGREYGRATKREIDSAIAFTETMPGYTARDRENIKKILYRALGEKILDSSSQHAPGALHATADAHTASDQKTSADTHKTPVMHTPHVVMGKHIENAADAPPMKQDSEDDTPEVSASAPDTGSTKSSVGKKDDAPYDTATHEAEHAVSEPLSSRESFRERLARKRAERNVFNQYEQSTTRLTKAGHEGSAGSFKERQERRRREREELNKPAKAQEEHDTPVKFHMPSISSHTTYDTGAPKEKSASHKEHDEASSGMHVPAMKLRMPIIPTGEQESLLGDVPDAEQAPDSMPTTVDLNTNLGVISIALFTHDAPSVAEQFLALVKNGRYDGTSFHRVVDGYVIQAGEPAPAPQGDVSNVEKRGGQPHSNMQGTVSMVSTDKNNTSGVFSINVGNNAVLDGRYPVFGKVIAGMDVVEAISKVPTDSNETPKQPIVIESISVS